jgi:hypothetical protein
MLTRELHVVACRDDSPLLQKHRVIAPASLPSKPFNHNPLMRYPWFNRLRFKVIRQLPHRRPLAKVRRVAPSAAKPAPIL